MEYKYITENNLENRQYYMYSEYGGSEFIKSYLAVREQAIQVVKPVEDSKEFDVICEEYLNHRSQSPTFLELKNLLCKVMQNRVDDAEISFYLKTFEVRKRIYTEYDKNTGKPAEGANYQNRDNYILFSVLMCHLYKQTHKLQYLNALLKVNDTLISIQNLLGESENQILQEVLKQEVGYLKLMREDKHVTL